MWKCASSLRCWDSNPQPSEHESPPIITMPGLPPSLATILLYDLFFASSSLYCTFLTTREPIFPVTFCPIQSWSWLQKMLLFQERKNSKMKTSYFQKHFANDFFSSLTHSLHFHFQFILLSTVAMFVHSEQCLQQCLYFCLIILSVSHSMQTYNAVYLIDGNASLQTGLFQELVDSIKSKRLNKNSLFGPPCRYTKKKLAWVPSCSENYSVPNILPLQVQVPCTPFRLQ